MALSDGEILLLRLEANMNKYVRDIGRARQRTNKELGAIEARFLRARKTIDASAAGLSRNLAGRAGSFLGPLAAAASVKGAQELIDASTRINNALRVTGLEGQALEAVYDQLFESAQRNAAPIETLVGLYSKLALVQSELGVDQQQLVGFTDKIAMALRAGGTSAQQASGALLQLSQALGGGTVRAEEFNSILEGAPTIAQAVAAGLEEAGGSVAKLRQLVVDGAVSSQVFFRAFEAGAYTLEEKLAGSQATVAQGFTRLANTLVDTARELNEGTDASEKMAAALAYLSEVIASTDFSPLISGVMNFGAEVGAVIGQVRALAKAAGDLTGASSLGPALLNRITGGEQGRIQSRIDGAFAADPKGDRPGRQPTDAGTIRPKVSIADYPAAGKSSGGSRGRRGGGGGGSSRTSDLEREIEAAQRRTILLQTETALLAAINPALDQYGGASEAASLKARLLTAAQQEGVAVTPALTARIDEIANAYGNAAGEAAKLAEEQDNVRSRAQEFANLAGGVVSGFIADLRQGKSASEALANALNKVIDQLIDMAIQALIVGPIMKMFGFSGGGIVPGGGKILSLASGGRVAGPGTSTSDSIPAMLSNGEHVINAKSAARWRPLLEAINADRVPGFSDGGAIGSAGSVSSRLGSGSDSTVNFAPTINVQAAQGGDPQQNRAQAELTAREIQRTIRGLIMEEFRIARRPGNPFNRRGG
jgi:tape measure domain-containing protein